MKASDLMVKALENEGVEYIFGIPGEENLDLLESIRTSKIELVLTRHEQVAGFMAATYGRLTRKVGVVLTTLGPGATNLTTAAAYAQLGGMPMLMITGQKPIKRSKQGLFQIVDIVDIMKPVTKYTKQIVSEKNITSVVRNAFKVANSPRQGAVHIELPEDIAAEEVTDWEIYPVREFEYPRANGAAIKEAVRMIEEAKHPLLMIASGANHVDISDSLTNFINETGIPFFSTQMGKGVVNENHKHCLTTAALSEGDFIHRAIEHADLIINVGHDEIEKPPFFMSNEEGATKVLHVNFFESKVDPTYFPQLDILGDIAANVEMIRESISVQKHWDFDFYEKMAAEIKGRLSKYFGDTRFPILPQRLVRMLRASLSGDSIVALDNGMYKIWFARNYRCRKPNTLLLDNALATMGAGLPSAMMAKMLNPDKKVVAVCGDGGFMMNAQDMETAVRLGLDLIVIVLNDEAYGMIKWKQETSGFADFGLDVGPIDFIKHAESYGAKGYRPTSCYEFGEVLGRTLQKKGVHLIDLRIDYSLNHTILGEIISSFNQEA